MYVYKNLRKKVHNKAWQRRWSADKPESHPLDPLLTQTQIPLQLGLELILSHTLAHGSRRRNATSDGLHEVVHVIGTRPLKNKEMIRMVARGGRK